MTVSARSVRPGFTRRVWSVPRAFFHPQECARQKKTKDRAQRRIRSHSMEPACVNGSTSAWALGFCPWPSGRECRWTSRWMSLSTRWAPLTNLLLVPSTNTQNENAKKFERFTSGMGIKRSRTKCVKQKNIRNFCSKIWFFFAAPFSAKKKKRNRLEGSRGPPWDFHPKNSARETKKCSSF